MDRKSLPNLVTGVRLSSIPVLWALALGGWATAVGIGLVLAWATDVLDGVLARALGAETEWGSKFDSATDALMFLSAIGWVALLRPDFVRAHGALLTVWLALGAAAYLVGWIRFRRLADIHLYSAKAANFMGFLFAAYLLMVDAYPPVLFGIVIGVCILAAAETLVAVSAFERVDERLVTVLRPPSAGDDR